MHSNIKYWIAGIGALLIIMIAGMTVHQKNHFNKNVTINNIAVGGLTAKQAFDKVKGTSGATKVYVDNKLVYQTKSMKANFNNNDEQKFNQALKKQFTFFPSRKATNLSIKPDNFDQDSLNIAKNKLTNKVQQLNTGRKAPVDAYAVYQNEKVTVVPAVKGNKYDLQNAVNQLNNQAGSTKINITLHKEQPIAANSKTVKNEEKQLNKLKGKKVTYLVQSEKYDLTTSQIITRATYQNGKYHFDTAALNKQVKEINEKHATLDKPFKFRTHSGAEITTTANGSYGWKISEKKAGNSLTKAIIDGRQEVDGKHDIEGKGYNTAGLGYNVTSNNGIGDTYAEVSLADQRAYFYKDGKCVLETDIVSGTNNEGNKTPKGVWYIMYQQSPSVLRGQNDDGSSYASKVNYWSPFTLTGCGFHDASWRHNWSKTAYLSDGSHGCINMQPSVAGQAFHDLTQNEPVIIY
ncbi:MULTISPECIES: L,D-transpeptidase family protein [Limosilactobacillus]|uniref:L,D-transpeptidase/peptidoglycan binding protein n=1 Tax=Limosilactobacillus balticus TaxID=2759747 RepID=A0ABS8RBZ2_9LACO|nr:MULTISPECIES: L,D-transpeptidase family protein [Limosilactobacillus]MBB1127858.1 L,D-transpeptidase [Limosilactobacillus balticus]MCD7136635.1 L,D-transpeptidase/peptidoglycan binding protein [Limosilactobacillus balticus]MCD7138549.1 L,D-transpeptidase/peptidoglycan binding protein [Limosilactobacillus balticus]MDE7040905.1 L,D-transpeptidase/peptidoglycan binding protein [Limosilactobacillus sp.]